MRFDNKFAISESILSEPTLITQTQIDSLVSKQEQHTKILTKIESLIEFLNKN